MRRLVLGYLVPLAVMGSGCLNVVAPLTTIDGGIDSGVDAGDAGRTDAGLSDAGPVTDAGVDGGVTDAGVDGGEDGGVACLPDAGVTFSCTIAPTPGFGTEATANDPINSWAFAAADFNNDGLADLLKVGWTLSTPNPQWIYLYYGLSDGGLSPGPTFAGTGLFVAVGDLNGDGWEDFVSDNTIEFNQGNGSFSPQYLIPTQGIASSAVIADLDGDGRPDITYCTNAGVEAYFDQDGSFNGSTPPTLVVPSACQGLAIGDFDQDGLPDLAETQSVYLGPPTNETVLVRFGLGQGTFSDGTSYMLDEPGYDIASADLDGDGWPDLVVAVADGVAELKNEGCGVFRGPEGFGLPGPITVPLVRLLVGDVNGDCYPEVVAWGSTTCDQSAMGQVLLFPNYGPGGVGGGTNVATSIEQPWGAALWQPGNATLSSLILGEFCSGNYGLLPNATQ